MSGSCGPTARAWGRCDRGFLKRESMAHAHAAPGFGLALVRAVGLASVPSGSHTGARRLLGWVSRRWSRSTSVVAFLVRQGDSGGRLTFGYSTLRPRTDVLSR